MRFMLIIKASKDSEASRMPSTELLTAMGAFNEQLVKAGVVLAAEGLQPSSKGARVHFRGDERSVSEGPFMQSGELIAGFWLIQASSLDEAITWVKRCPKPHDENTHIEIRQVFEADDFGETLSPGLRKQEKHLRASIIDAS